MSKLSKQDKKKIYDKYLAEMEFEENNPYKILHDFNIDDELIDNNKMKFQEDDLGSLICLNNSFRVEDDRSTGGDFRNQSDFVVRIYDKNLLLFEVYYTYSMKDRTIDCRKKPYYFIDDGIYDLDELIITALSNIEDLYYCRVGA